MNQNQTPLPSTPILTVSDIKQYFYCPRIVYFNYLMPSFRPITYKMEEGKVRQAEEIRLELRRSLSRFGIKGIKPHARKQTGDMDAQKLFGVRLTSHRLGLTGVVDMAIIAHNEVIPVDFKDGAFSTGEVVAIHHKYQLLTYGLLLQELYRKRAQRGFIHSLEDGNTKSVYFTDGAREFLMGKIKKIRQMIQKEILPYETPHKGRCNECEFKPVCKG